MITSGWCIENLSNHYIDLKVSEGQYYYYQIHPAQNLTGTPE